MATAPATPPASSKRPDAGPGVRHVEDRTRGGVVVIGAGSAGLAAAAALKKKGIGSTVLEQGPAIGTSWRARHQELRLNTIRWLSDLPGLRLPPEAGPWVSRNVYVDYLERFAIHHGLDVRCGVSVKHVTPDSAGWTVTSTAGSFSAEHVVVATGHDQVPIEPDFPGLAESTIPVRHVANHRRAADLVGRRVLLVGGGNSGVEIAGHLVDANVRQLWMSVRRSPNILPRKVAGIPLHPLTLVIRPMPERFRDALARTISRLTLGDLTPYGLPTPPDGPYERMRTTGVTVAVDQGFVRHLHMGHVTIVPAIREFDGDEVVLADGRRITPDVVLTATGFRPGYSRLFPIGMLDDIDTSHPSGPLSGLWFIGFTPAIEGNLRQHPIEARRIARAIARRARRHPVVQERTPRPSRPAEPRRSIDAP